MLIFKQILFNFSLPQARLTYIVLPLFLFFKLVIFCLHAARYFMAKKNSTITTQCLQKIKKTLVAKCNFKDTRHHFSNEVFCPKPWTAQQQIRRHGCTRHHQGQYSITMDCQTVKTNY